MKIYENEWKSMKLNENYSPHSLPLPLILPPPIHPHFLYVGNYPHIVLILGRQHCVEACIHCMHLRVILAHCKFDLCQTWTNLYQNGYGIRNAKMATCIAIWLGLSLGVTEMVGGRGAMGLCMDLDYSILLMGFDYAICIIGMGKSISNTICNSIGKFNRQFNRQYNSQYNQQLYQTN